VRLVAKVLGFVLSKAFLAGAMTVVLFLGYWGIGELQEAVAGQDRLEEIDADRTAREKELDTLRARYKESQSEAQSELIESLADTVEGQIALSKQKLADQRRTIDRLQAAHNRACNFLGGRPADVVLPGRPCEDARQKVRAAKATLREWQQKRENAERDAAILADPTLTPGQKLERLGEDPDQRGDPRIKKQIGDKERQLDDVETKQRKQADAQDSWAGWLVNQWGSSREAALQQWSQVWLGLLGIVLLILLTPVILRTVAYFVLMPLVSRAQKPLQLAAEPEHAAATLHASPAERTLPIRLSAGEVLSARSEDVRPVQGKVRSQLLYNWKAPFISYATGLHSLSRVTGDADGTEATLAASDDPNSYLMRIDFTDHPGIVMRPKHVVGVMGVPELETRWRWGIQSLATWQVRYIMFAGTGSLIVQGSGSVEATSPGHRATKMDQHLMMGFDSRLTARINRTEVFWPYLRGKAPLVDDEFTGPYLLFWQKSDTAGPSNPAVKAFNAVFSAIGKLLGF
jgi:hypothetical protein